MQNRRRRLKIIFIFVLFVDSFSTKYGSCAPTKSQLLDNNTQKVKRSAEFMNYLSSIFYRSTSSNYPDSSWNFYEPQPQPKFDYETNFIQYPNHVHTAEDQNYIHWPKEQDMNKFNYFQTIPNDHPPPAMVTYIEDDSSSLERGCGCDQNSLEHDMDWNVPPNSIDESIFHNFYLIPGYGDISRESYLTTTTAKPEEEEATSNISIFDCSSNPVQKDFLEKVLSNNSNDEYLVLLIKRNPFLVGKEQENKTEIIIPSPPPDIELEPISKNPSSFIAEIPEDVAFEESIKSNENGESSKPPEKVEKKITVNIDLDLVSSPKQESSTDIRSSTVSTIILPQEDIVQQNEDEIFKEGDKVSDVAKIKEDFQEITTTGSSVGTIPSEEFVKQLEIPINEQNDNSFATEAQKEIPVEENRHIQTIGEVEIPTKVKIDDKIKMEEKVTEVTVEIDSPNSELPPEIEIQTAEENNNAESEIMKQEQNLTDVLFPGVSIQNIDGILEVFSTTTISSQIVGNEALQGEIRSRETIEVPKLKNEDNIDSSSSSSTKPIEDIPHLLSD